MAALLAAAHLRLSITWHCIILHGFWDLHLSFANRNSRVVKSSQL